MTEMLEKHLVVVEGVIGAGKTTLARFLGEATGARLMLEEVEENPYLEEFYLDRRRFAFQTQITFLLSRYQQQQELLQRDIFSPRVVTDYLFQKDRIFANVNLNDKELALYERLFPILERDIPAPDLVVFLQASTRTLLERIHRRGRSFERDMDPGYLEALNEAYNYFFFHYEASALLVVDTDGLDFVAHPEEREDLLAQIESHAGGTVYYRPPRGGRP
jgi:deoxyadenosine/deoxycytidine kinase